MELLRAELQPVFFVDHAEEIKKNLDRIETSSWFIVTDENTSRLCLPLIKEYLPEGTKEIQILSGEKNKNVQTVENIWKKLLENGADRHSVLILLGGGVLTDMGGFAAATFKRGMRFIYIPTTLMGMVDAAIGGKTGINLDHAKNQSGVFQGAHQVFIYTGFLETLEKVQLLSAYAECIKHALIDPDLSHIENLLKIPFAETRIKSLILSSVLFKVSVVEADPFENGSRKILNFGHTIGHAVESAEMQYGNAVPHGICIAAGMLMELYLSVKKLYFPESWFEKIKIKILTEFKPHLPEINQSPAILEFLQADKKNRNGKFLFVLLKNIGETVTNVEVGEEEIEEAIQFYKREIKP